MTITAINPSTVPASPFYSQGIVVQDADRIVYVSGQVGITADGTVLDGIEAQAAQAVSNLNAVLDAAGMTAADLTKLTIYLTDPADIGPFMAAMGGALPQTPPATTMLLVQGLADPSLRVEIEGIAAR